MTYHVVDSLEKIEDLRGIWNRYHDQQKNASFMNDIEYYKIQMAAHPDENSPFLLVGEEEESITTLVIGFLRSVKFAPKIGYIKLPLFRKSKRCLYIIPNGFLGLLDEETGKAVVSNLVDVMKTAKIDYIHVSSVPADCNILSMIKAKTSWLCREHFRSPVRHHFMKLPESMEAFYKSRSAKSRHNLKRCATKFIESAKGNMNIEMFWKTDDVEAFCVNAENIARKTYQRALGAGFRDSATMRLDKYLKARNGWFRSYILYVSGSPISFIDGIRYQDTYYTESIGYLPETEKYGTGTFLFLKMVEDLLMKNEIRYIDFGYGNDLYKERFGNICRNEISVQIFACTLNGLLMNTMALVCGCLTMLGRYLSRSLGVYGQLRKVWRNRLRKG